MAGRLSPVLQGCWALDSAHAVADNFVVLQETLDRLRLELAELHASRKRLVLAADDDRRRLERDLHEGVQQHLVALAVKLQLARADPAALETLIEEMQSDVKQALDETAQLARRIYPSLEAGGLAAALRSAAVSSGVPASVDVSAGGSYPAEVLAAVQWCWLEALEHTDAGTHASITVRDEDGALAFEVVGGDGSERGIERLRDRVEALGGRLTVRSKPDRLAVSLPLPG
jgi:signal transduction histidine kinase